MFPANGVVPSPSPRNWPPSWSAPISGGAAEARRIASVSSRTWPGDATFANRKSVIPAEGAVASRVATSSGSAVPSNASMSDPSAPAPVIP
jgi:hypothetical protein